MRVIAVLDTVGNALLLQLACFICSIPIVTAAPASVALQRQLADLSAGRRTSPRTFVREFRRAWRQAAALGVFASFAGVGFLGALPFWYAVPTWYGRLALAAVLLLLGSVLAFSLNVLRVATEPGAGAWRGWLRPALHHLLTHPAPTLAGTALLLVWLLVLGSFPTLLLVGSGLAPAVVVRVTLGGPVGVAP